MANALPPIGTTQDWPPANCPPPLDKPEQAPSSSLIGRVTVGKREQPHMDILLKIHEYTASVKAQLEAIPDPLKRALFLIQEHQKHKSPYLQAPLANLIKLVCDGKDTDDLLILKEALPFAKMHLEALCKGENSPDRLNGVARWVLFQSLILLRQIQVMALTPEEISPLLLICRLQKITAFISSLPKDLKALIGRTKEICVEEIKGLLFKNLKRLLFKNDPLPDSFDERASIEEQFTVMVDFLQTREALIKLESQTKNHPLLPITTLPVISSLESNRPPIEGQVDKLEQAKKEFLNQKIPMPFRLMALSRFVYYSTDPINKDNVPASLLEKLDCGTGKALYPNELRVDPFTFQIVGQQCRLNIARQKSLCVHGAILAIYEEIQSYVLQADETFGAIEDAEEKKVESFHLFHSFNQLLSQLLDLKRELFADQFTQAGQTLDETLNFVMNAITDIIDTGLEKEITPYLRQWSRLTAFDPHQLENLMKTANHLVNFYQYFLLRRLITICNKSIEEKPNDLIVKMLTQFDPKDRLRLIQPLCESEKPRLSPEALWETALRNPLCLFFTRDSIRDAAMQIVVTLVDTCKQPRL